MSETSFEEYRRMVERQTRALMDVIQSVALGDLDVLVESPPEGEGVEVLSELAVGVEMMVDDLREMLAERERAVAKMEAALARTEALYEGSERVVRATTIDDVLQALVYSTVLRRLARNSILLFDHPWGDRRPHIMTVVAAWERDASLGVLSSTDEEPRSTVGVRYVLEQFPATRLFDRQEPGIVRDIATDERLDENTRALFLEGLGLRSLVIFPLVAGEQWIGVFVAQDSAVLEMDEAEVRQITTLVGQAAAVIQGLRLIEEAQARARREQTLRRITTSARGFVDAETVMRTVVRELGTALGRPTFIRLGSAEELAQGSAVQPDDGGQGVALREGGE